MGRIIIFTGKGGVGKTSVAAAHAVSSAQEGIKTLLVSADMAHNLGDIFNTKIGREITNIKDNLYAIELDPYFLMKEDFPNVQKSIFDLFGSSGRNVSHVADHFILPGFENLFSLLKLKSLYESNQFERIIVDCAPTGETLSLLKLPELLSWYMEKFFPVGKVMVRVLSPISKIKYGVKLPSRKATNEMEQMHYSLLDLQELLKNKEICTIRLVCIPEKMVIEETKRNYMYMSLYGYQVDGVFINRILSEEVQNPFMKKLRVNQEKYIQEIKNVFTEIPITKIKWYKEEIRGYQAIETLCNDVLNTKDLFEVRANTESEEYLANPNGYTLKINIPGANNDNVKVFCHNTDINIKVNNFNRCIPLPNTLCGSEITDVQVKDDTVKIDFKVKQNDLAKEEEK